MRTKELQSEEWRIVSLTAPSAEVGLSGNSPHSSDLEKLLGTKIYLDRGVKVAKTWSRDPK